jgi:hypothetical protein
MGIEYHGWVALATSHDDWCDSDLEEGFRRVEERLQRLVVENGHDPVMPAWRVLPRMVYFKGNEAESVAPVLHVRQEVAAVFDKAYGELVAFDNKDGQDIRFDLALADRYRLVDGEVMIVALRNHA